MRTPKRCLKYDSTRNFYYQIYNIIMPDIYIYSWIYENMVDENYSRCAKTGPNKLIYQPDEPEKHRKERREGKGTRARERKKL